MNRYEFHQPKQPRKISIGQVWHFRDKIDPFKIIDMAEGKWKVRFLKREDVELMPTEFILDRCVLFLYGPEPIEIDTTTKWPRVYINSQGIPVVKKTRHRGPTFDSGYYYKGVPIETEWVSKRNYEHSEEWGDHE